MKKTAIALAAVAALGLAACGGNKANTSANGSAATTNAVADVNAATTAESETTNALNAEAANSANQSNSAGNVANSAGSANVANAATNKQ